MIEQDEAGMTAEVGLAFSGFHQSFTTRNTHVPGREVHLKLVDGPFSKLDGVWKFTPVGERGRARLPRRTGPAATASSNFALQALVGPVFDKIASNLVEAFVKRAEQVYGAAPDASQSRVACSPAPREVFEAGAGAAGRRDGARRGAGQRPGRDASRNSTGRRCTPGVWGRAVDWDQRAARTCDRVELCRAAHGRSRRWRGASASSSRARAAPGLFAKRRKGGKAGY